jgi:hypothetical protein
MEIAMRRTALLTLTSGLLLSGCSSDLVSPVQVAGRYTLASFDETSVSSAAPQTPFLGVTSVVDSIRDTVVLSSDRTYGENGGIWGYDAFQGDTAVLFQAHGTYTVQDAAINLTQTTGVTVTGGSGLIVGDTLTVTRYPGTWVWVKE